MDELVRASAQEASSSATERPRGLYQELLFSRPEAMYQDSLDHPEKYQESVRNLLRSLVSSGREPGPAERKQLDAAVLDFSYAPRAKPTATKRTVAKAPLPRKMPEFPSTNFPGTSVNAESPDEGRAIPAGEPKPFWWL